MKGLSVKSTIYVIILAVAFGLVFWYGSFDDLGGITTPATQDERAAALVQGWKDETAADFVKQYEIAKRSGTAMDACVHAGLAGAAFLQSKNEAEYQKWKKIEKADCQAAGISK